jgi:HEAT repeat protein
VRAWLWIGYPLILLFLVALVSIPAPTWLKVLAALAAGGVWLRYRWKTGGREKTIEGLGKARRERLDRSEPSMRETDDPLARLFDAHARGDTDYLIESLTRYPEHATLPASWLSESGEMRAVPALVRLLDSSNPDARTSATRALEQLGPPIEARSRLIELMEDESDSVRSWACSAVGHYKDPELLPVLLSLLEDDDWRVRNGAAMGLGKLGDSRALLALRGALRRSRRSPLRWYLNRIGLKRAIQMLKNPEHEDTD